MLPDLPRQDRASKSLDELRKTVQIQHLSIQTVTTQATTLKEKVQSLLDGQQKMEVFVADVSQALEGIHQNKDKMEYDLKQILHHQAEQLQQEIKRIDDFLDACSFATMEMEVKNCTEKVGSLDVLANDNKKKLSVIQRQLIDSEATYNANFTNIYESI